MFKSVEDLQRLGQEQMSVATASASAFSNGLQQLFSEAALLSRTTFETGTEAFQSLLASRSVDGAVQVQVDFAKTAYDSMVAASTKLGGIVSTTTQDMVKPFEGAVQRMQGAWTAGPSA